MPVTVSRAAYVHDEDVNPDKSINGTKMNENMCAAVCRAATALQDDTGDYTDLQRGVMEATLRSAMTSHSGVCDALARGHENPTSVDALALARIPLESLYNICLFTESGDWINQYMRDDWKKHYVQFLLQERETANLQRFKEYSESQRSILMQESKLHGVTEEEVATIDYEQLEAPEPAKKCKIKHFPTPASVIGKLEEGSDKRRMLERLYCEYRFLCIFVHSLPTASFFKDTFDITSAFTRFWEEGEREDVFRKEVADRAYVASWLGVVQATAEIADLYPGNVELRAAVAGAWEEMSRDCLLGRAIWHLRTKKLLGVVEGT